MPLNRRRTGGEKGPNVALTTTTVPATTTTVAPTTTTTAVAPTTVTTVKHPTGIITDLGASHQHNNRFGVIWAGLALGILGMGLGFRAFWYRRRVA